MNASAFLVTRRLRFGLELGLPVYKIKKCSHGVGVNILCLISHDTMNLLHLVANSIALRFPFRTKVEDCFKRKTSADVQDWNSCLKCNSSGSRHFKGWKLEISEVQLKVSIVEWCHVPGIYMFPLGVIQHPGVACRKNLQVVFGDSFQR